MCCGGLEVMLRCLDGKHVLAALTEIWAPLRSNFLEWWEENKEAKLKEQARVRQIITDWARLGEGLLSRLQALLDAARGKVAAKRRMDIDIEASWRRDQEEVAMLHELEKERRIKQRKEEDARLDLIETRRQPGSWGAAWSEGQR
jgi:hypothetical protein